MELLFEETANRSQCAVVSLVNDEPVQCVFFTTRMVTIPRGLSFWRGLLELDSSMVKSTIPICKNHEARLQSSFDEFNRAE